VDCWLRDRFFPVDDKTVAQLPESFERTTFFIVLFGIPGRNSDGSQEDGQEENGFKGFEKSEHEEESRKQKKDDVQKTWRKAGD